MTEGASIRSRDWRREMATSWRKAVAIAFSTWFSNEMAYTTMTRSSEGTMYIVSFGRKGMT